MNLSDFDRYIPVRTLRRGTDCWQEKRVIFLGEDGDEYCFEVEDSESLHSVYITLDGDNVKYWQCNCYSYDICSHIVACLFYLRSYLGVHEHSDEQKATETLEGLSSMELAYLCYQAYASGMVSGKTSGFPKAGGLDTAKPAVRKSMDEKLRFAGWLTKQEVAEQSWIGHHTYTYQIKAKHWIDVLKVLYSEHTDWAEKFSVAGTYSIEGTIMSEIALYFLNGTPPPSKRTAKGPKVLTDEFREAVWMAFASQGGDRLPGLLPGWLIDMLLQPLLQKSVIEGDAAALERVRKVFDAIDSLPAALLPAHALFRRTWFFFKGDVLEAFNGEEKCPACQLMLAARLLFAGQTDAAIGIFSQFSGFHTKYTAAQREVIDDYICKFLYICALAIRSSDKDIQTLRWISSELLRSQDSASLSLNVFSLSLLGDNQSDHQRYNSYTSWKRTPLMALLCRLVEAYVYDGKMTGEAPEVTCALLDNEIRAVVDGYKAKMSWPYAAVITRIRRREAWEAEIDKLLSMVSVDDDPSRERLIYYYNGYGDKLEIRVQGKLKSGKPSKGRELSSSRYHNEDCPMDETDKAIKAAWNGDYWSFNPPLEVVIPFCVGKDKIYTDTKDYGFTAVEIVEEKPYICTERSGGNICFSSNVTTEALKSKGSLLYDWSRDMRKITFWRLDKALLPVLKGILSLKSVPLAAEPMLERLIVPLHGKLEVQSDIKGGIHLEKKEGSAVLCVRITPDGQDYCLTVLARPLADGKVYLSPGQEPSVVVDENDEGRFEVTRDLKREKKNLRIFKETLNGIGPAPAARTGDFIWVNCQQLLGLLENMPKLSEVCCIEWPQGKPLRLTQPSSSAFHISAVGKGGWFELEGELQVSEDTVVSVATLLEMSRGQQRYIQISDGQYMLLSDELRRQLGRLESVSQMSKGKLAVPELAMSVLSDAVSDIVDIEGEEPLFERQQLIREAATMDFPVPEGLNAILRPYQEDGYRWMMRLAHWGAGACLADDMGLGKTVESIAFMLAKASEGPQLVVAPASVVSNWESELLRFAPSLRVLVLNGLASKERDGALAVTGPSWVVVTTYGVMVTDVKALSGIKWTTVVLDEAHTIKNRETKMSGAVMKLSAVNRILLTGTPIQNHLGELWNLFHFINPGLLGGYDHFQNCFVNSDSAASRDALKRLVSPFMLRRTKNEVVRELPDKTEVFLPVSLSDEEMSVYEILRREAKAELAASSSLSVNALAMMTKLRMASCSASLVEKNWTGGSSKLAMFTEKLSALVEGGNNVLVFSQFTSFLELAVKEMEKAGLKDYLYLDGSTPVAKRKKMVDSFQRGDVPVFLISLKAGGLGLNLTGANYVIHLDPWWNPAIEQQATDRAYRIGQQHKVTVYHLIAKNTIEEKIIRLHDTKRQLADSILSGTSASHKLTAEEILALIS